MNRHHLTGAKLAIVIALGATFSGCVAPAPQVIYISYPPASETPQRAPAPQAAVTPRAEEPSPELRCNWRDYCIGKAPMTGPVVTGRKEGVRETEMRDIVLQREAALLREQINAAETRQEKAAMELLAGLPMLAAGEMVELIYAEPYGSREDRRDFWISHRLGILEGVAR